MRAGMTALVLATSLLSAAVTPVPGAVAHEPPAVHGTEEPGVIAALRAKGARVLALGERGGLDGHFVELADGDAYGLYVTPDGHAVAGLLYGPDGTLLTGDQIAAAGGQRNPNDVVPTDDPALLAHAFDEGRAVPAAVGFVRALRCRLRLHPGAHRADWWSCSPIQAAAGRARRWRASADRRSTDGCASMWSRSACSAPPRPARLLPSPPPPIPQWPGSRGRMRRAVRKAGGGSRATTACSTLGASARCP